MYLHPHSLYVLPVSRAPRSWSEDGTGNQSDSESAQVPKQKCQNLASQGNNNWRLQKDLTWVSLKKEICFEHQQVKRDIFLTVIWMWQRSKLIKYLANGLIQTQRKKTAHCSKRLSGEIDAFYNKATLAQDRLLYAAGLASPGQDTMSKSVLRTNFRTTKATETKWGGAAVRKTGVYMSFHQLSIDSA